LNSKQQIWRADHDGP